MTDLTEDSPVWFHLIGPLVNGLWKMGDYRLWKAIRSPLYDRVHGAVWYVERSWRMKRSNEKAEPTEQM